MSDELLTPEEAAEWLKVARGSVYRWLQDGTLRAVKLGRVYRIPKAEVLALVRRQGGDEAEGMGGDGDEDREGEQ